MNVAALMCASLLDLFRITLKHGFAIPSLPDNHFLNDGNRLLLFMGAHTHRPCRRALPCLEGLTAQGATVGSMHGLSLPVTALWRPGVL
jgi:hypothetical protein